MAGVESIAVVGRGRNGKTFNSTISVMVVHINYKAVEARFSRREFNVNKFARKTFRFGLVNISVFN